MKLVEATPSATACELQRLVEALLRIGYPFNRVGPGQVQCVSAVRVTRRHSNCTLIE